MNSSQFMDKQITALSESQGGEFFDLINPQDEQQKNNGGVTRKEEIVPSYDFQPLRTVGSSSTMNSNLDGARQSRISADSRTGSSNLRFSGVLEPHELAKVSQEKERDSYDVTTVAEIDRTVKKHVDNLLHALEGVSSRLSQLESRTRHLESSVDDLKDSIGNNYGSTDGKLRQVENILREVQACTQVLRDKQEIAEAQIQLVKLQQASKADHQQLENSNIGQLDSRQQQQLPQTAIAPPPPQPQPQLPPAPQQNPSSVQFPVQPQQGPPLPSLPRDYSYPQPADASTHQQYQVPAQPQQQQHYQPSPQIPQYPQPMQPPPPLPPQNVNPTPHFQAQLPHHPEESAPPYIPPPQIYPPNIRQPAPQTQQPPPPPPPSGPHHPQYLGSNPGSMYELQSTRLGPGGYGLTAAGPGFNEPYPYSGSPTHYSGSGGGSMKQSPFAPSGGYPRLPTAQILPQAASSSPPPPLGSGPGGNRVAVDDVVDKVATMGFSKEQVRATVRKLTENGQSVDLNVVLDKLMNDNGSSGGGEMIQPQKGWFGR